MGIDLKLLKKIIYENQRIEELLECLDCQNIKIEQNGDLITAQLPDRFNSNNKRSVQVKNNESLTAYVRSRDVSGDIYSIVGYIEYDCQTFDEVKENLFLIISYICNVLNIDTDFKVQKKEKKIDYLWFLRDVQKQRDNGLELKNIPENIPINKNIMNQYISMLHKKWYDEGINRQTIKYFDIRFDIQSERIVFPVHNENGDIIGVKGRAVDNNDEFKYIYLYPCYKSLELFNLHRALPFIKKYKKVYIFEGAKTCFLSSQWGVLNCVSIEGDRLSPIQAKKLKKLGLNINFIFVFDNDKDINFIKRQVSQIKGRITKIVIDKDKLLGEPKDKMSPTDKGEVVFKKLLNDYILTIG